MCVSQVWSWIAPLHQFKTLLSQICNCICFACMKTWVQFMYEKIPKSCSFTFPDVVFISHPCMNLLCSFWTKGISSGSAEGFPPFGEPSAFVWNMDFLLDGDGMAKAWLRLFKLSCLREGPVFNPIPKSWFIKEFTLQVSVCSTRTGQGCLISCRCLGHVLLWPYRLTCLVKMKYTFFLAHPQSVSWLLEVLTSGWAQPLGI